MGQELRSLEVAVANQQKDKKFVGLCPTAALKSGLRTNEVNDKFWKKFESK